MARVLVQAAKVDGSSITTLKVKLGSLPAREIDRDTAVAWMKDGHSFIPVEGGQEGPAWQLVLVGDDETPFIRADTQSLAEDATGSVAALG